MPLPTFSKVGVTTVTFSQPPVFPAADPLVLNQFVGVSDFNTIKVASIGPPLRTLNLRFEELTRTDKANLEAFFANPLVNYGQGSFTYTDHIGIARTVQFLDQQLAMPEVSDNNVSAEFVLTVLA
jgi:hypothetical protein